MIHPSTKIQILDLSRGESMLAPIEDVFNLYADRAKWKFKDSAVINFRTGRESPIRIQEWTGWTELIRIEKLSAFTGTWFQILSEDYEGSINITEEELIPVYSPEDTKNGFHGEVKFKYILKNPGKITEGEYLRSRTMRDISINSNGFTRISVSEYRDSSPAYLLVTKSSFYNGNKFHMWGNDIIPVSEVNKWYK